jgi:hypothetical protein
VASASARDLTTVASDLAYLDHEWTDDVDDETIRRNSNVLRVLLIDGWYGRGWRAAGKTREPSVSAIDLRDVFAVEDIGDVEYAQAGGGRSFGVNVPTPTVHNRAMKPEEILARYQRGRAALEQGLRPHERWYMLTEFLESPSILANGRYVSRRLVVKYMANRLGGTHLGASGHDESQVFDFLDEVSEPYWFAGRPTIHFEVLSIGQAIGRSADARELRSVLSHP